MKMTENRILVDELGNRTTIGPLASKLMLQMYRENIDTDETEVYWNVKYKEDAKWPEPGEVWCYNEKTDAWTVTNRRIYAIAGLENCVTVERYKQNG